MISTPVITGFAQDTVSTEWEKFLPTDRIPDGQIVQAVKKMEKRLVETAVKAWHSAAMDASAATVSGAVFGTMYGTNCINEYIYSSLANGSKWLNAEAFLYYSPHSCPGAVVQNLGLHGDAITIVGCDADDFALLHSARLISLQRQKAVLCTHFEWATPFASWLGERLGIGLNAHSGSCVSLVLEDAAYARERGARVLAQLDLALENRNQLLKRMSEKLNTLEVSR